MKNQITLQYGFVNSINDDSENIFKVHDLLKMLNTLKSSGLSCTPNLLQNLTTQMYNDIKDYYSSKVGEVFRRNFKNEISEDNFTDDDYIDQVFHYLVRYNFDMIDTSVFKHFEPNEPNEFIKPSKEFKLIDFKTYPEIIDYAQNLIDSPIVKNNFEILELINEDDLDLSNIKVKENIFKVMKYFKTAEKSIKTITDVKRYVYSLRNNNIDNPRHIALKTSEKRAVMKMLDRIHKSDEQTFLEIKNSREHFKAICNCIKPYSKFRKYKNALRVFDLVNYKKSLCTYNTLTEMYRSDILKFLKHLSIKPGLLLRNIDYIIRNIKDDDILDGIQILQDIEFNPKLLIQVISLIRYRKNNEINPRVFNVKGQLYKSNKVFPKLKNAEVFEDLFVNLLRESLRCKNFIDSFSLSDDLRRYNIPYEMRDSSKFRDGILTKGTRIPFKDAKFLRLFTAWSGKKGEATDVDVDLNASLILNDSCSSIWYGNQSSDYVVHSGDFTCSREVKDNVYTAEFIDIDLSKCTSGYCFGSNIVYSKNTFNDFNVFTGIIQLQNRQNNDFINLNDSEFYLKMDGNFNFNVPFVIDFSNKEIIIIDKYRLNLSGINVGSLTNVFKLMSYRYTEMDFSAYELLELYKDVNNVEDGRVDRVIDFNYCTKHIDKIYKLLS